MIDAAALSRAIRRTAEEDQVTSSLVFKEYVQIVILEYFFKKGLFPLTVFQGGTALRLAYQGVRYSEDLDFVLQKKNAAGFDKIYARLKPLASHIKKFIPSVSGAELTIQKETPDFHRYCLALTTDFLNAKDKTNIEIANVPSYKHQTVMVRHTDLALSPAVTVESPAEILSDKLMAFCARDYIKGRDLWDIYFITNTLKVPADREVVDMLKKKIFDYGFSPKNFPAMLAGKIELLEKSGISLLHEEMDRFLPAPYRAAYESKYPDICRYEVEIFTDLLERIRK